MELSRNAIIISILAVTTLLGLAFFTNIERINIVLGVLFASAIARYFFKGQIFLLGKNQNKILGGVIIVAVALYIIIKGA
jgi:hypothetical protein